MCHNTDGVAISKLYCVGLFPSAEKVDLNGIKEQSLRLESPLEPSRDFASRDNCSLPPRELMPRAANNSARSKERLWDEGMGVVDSEGGGHCLSERLSLTLLGMAVLLWATFPFSQKWSMLYASTVLLPTWSRNSHMTQKFHCYGIYPRKIKTLHSLIHEYL